MKKIQMKVPEGAKVIKIRKPLKKPEPPSNDEVLETMSTTIDTVAYGDTEEKKGDIEIVIPEPEIEPEIEPEPEAIISAGTILR